MPLFLTLIFWVSLLHFIPYQYHYQRSAFLKLLTSDHKFLLQHNGENWNIANLSERLLIHDARYSR
ncbi:unknown protein [Microcystis aeruginosa NIES-843]|uniref:Uncharacterized protein n=1 Tax=Microcystis aeruginosa (strain NIES-843 / IAM M-2473) TaxID=449447 RepID=B0JXQ0_MICAN|nr:unknown protein [Microcystis aeruginosa NIES-843]